MTEATQHEARRRGINLSWDFTYINQCGVVEKKKEKKKKKLIHNKTLMR